MLVKNLTKQQRGQRVRRFAEKHHISIATAYDLYERAQECIEWGADEDIDSGKVHVGEIEKFAVDLMHNEDLDK